MHKNTFTAFIYFINEFHLSKNYATQTLCSLSITQNFNRILLFNHIQINHLSRIVWQFGAFLLGDLAHQNNYSTLHRPSNTPAKDSSLLEIPNRVAIFPICCFLCHNSYYFVSLDVDKRISQCPKKLTTTRFITFPTFMRSSVTLIAFSETSHCFANVEILMRVFCYRESILLCPYCAPVMPLSCPNWSFADLFWSEC